MNYYEIGQRIRRYRKEKGLSQEQLAESVNISVTHMSHIETGNTKLSLPVLVDIAAALQVTVDDLLTDVTSGSSTKLLLQLTVDCTARQIDLICDIVRAVKNSLPAE